LTNNEKFWKFPKWIIPFRKSSHRYCVAHGGRAGGKTYEIAKFLIWSAMYRTHIILCAREIKNSIEDSSHAALCRVINDLGLNKFFHITRTHIRCKLTGSIFKFKGLFARPESIKSFEGATLAWIDEANAISAKSWELLEPTVRKAGSKIILSFNPENVDDCIYDYFITKKPPKESYVVQVNWYDNKYFSEESNKSRLHALETMPPEKYMHIWEGRIYINTESKVLTRDPQLWFIEDFKVDEEAYRYIGLDFGFKIDPTAAVESYIIDNCLYIVNDCSQLELEIDRLGEFCSYHIPNFKTCEIIADSARPEVIDHLARQGYNIFGAKKGQGSVMDGLAFLRSFDKIFIKPHCRATIDEFTNYSFIIDKRSGKVTNKVEDKNNHIIDALRYSLESCHTKDLITAYKNLYIF
jgi:phage terminase large subunit